VDRLRPRLELLARSGSARRGRLLTPHGVVETPAFFPVGTHGAVRGLTPSDLRALGVQGVLANTYHLHLRPGDELIERLGGLHRFMGWRGPMLSDSGGFQVHSLGAFARRGEEGVEFRDPVDGSRHFLTPEGAIAIQNRLGADLIAALDVFDGIGADEPAAGGPGARDAMERTLRWARRCRDAHRRSDQLLFGIVQGGSSEALRREAARATLDLGFEAFAIGGLGVGEPAERRHGLIECTTGELPAAAPRYLMGLGHPEDLVEAVARGIDLFDCVVPTRHGRHGHAFTSDGVINLRNARFRDDGQPLDAGSDDPVSGGFSRAYLHHLLRAGEALGARLLSQHNIGFYMRLMAQMREAIEADAFDAWRRGWLARYRGSQVAEPRDAPSPSPSR
jgi:queuine tRNA-ribosyltransferase